jgi:glycerol-3-phosphate dehydrogenase
LFDGEEAYILQNEDGRIVFAIPYLQRFTLIGTTDQEYQGDPAKVKISDGEIDYLLSVVNSHFKKPLARADIIHTYAGVRPLCDDESDDPSAVTRDYTLALDGAPGEAPLLSVFGGKLTTYRKLAESALSQLAEYFPQMKHSWTADAPLPGGEQMSSTSELSINLGLQYTWLPQPLALRWASSYGSRSWQLLEGACSLNDLGEHLGADLYAREVEYLCQHEWAKCAADILWRRSKLGLFISPSQQTKLEQYLLLRSAQGVHAA